MGDMPNVTGEHSALLREMERRAGHEERSYRRHFPNRADTWADEGRLLGEAAAFIDWCINEGTTPAGLRSEGGE